MASLILKPGGIYQIQYTQHRKRETISLGSMTAVNARQWKTMIQAILEIRWSGGSLTKEITDWLAKLDDEAHAKLSNKGLVPPRVKSQLGPFLEEYIAGRTARPLTIQNLKAAQTKLIAFFGEKADIASITRADAQRFAASFPKPNATRSRMIGYGKQFFNAAIDARIITENPFKGIKGGTQRNRDRHFLISEEVAQKVLAACPSAAWRLRFVLARYGGFRTPLEARRLKWADVNWELDRIGVRGKGGDGSITRYVPIFPEIHRELEPAFRSDWSGKVYVLPKQAHATNREGLLKILASAGIVPWPRLWHNLRMTRHSELSSVYPRFIVCLWLGNSEDVADQHYSMASDEQFKLAAQGKAFAAPTAARAAKTAAANDGL